MNWNRVSNSRGVALCLVFLFEGLIPKHHVLSLFNNHPKIPSRQPSCQFIKSETTWNYAMAKILVTLTLPKELSRCYVRSTVVSLDGLQPAYWLRRGLFVHLLGVGVVFVWVYYVIIPKARDWRRILITWCWSLPRDSYVVYITRS